MVEAGLIERFREGAWAFFRLAESGGSAELARALTARLDPNDSIISRDRERLTAVRKARAEAAQKYFREHAAQWDRIRKLHVTDEAVEQAISEALGGRPFHSLLDLGTGTGAIAMTIAGTDNALCTITVADSGVGLPLERDRIVEPYMTTRAGGTGLGLAIVGKILEEHGGGVELLDRPDGQRGACVRLFFPLDQTQTGPRAA